MIKVNDIEIKDTRFPDGTPEMLHVPNIIVNSIPGHHSIHNVNFCWNYEDESELPKLIYLVNHYKSLLGKQPMIKYSLYLPYIPNARMDRVKNDCEVFTLKWFCKVINSLEFDSVYVLDAHSDVSVALLNNVVKSNVERYIIDALGAIIKDNPEKEIIIYFPDAGAYKRYKDMYCVAHYKKIYGKKVRDWNTGEIKGLDIVDENDTPLKDKAVWPLANKVVLMIDDIISYGGTLYYSANKIKEFSPDKIYAYATHVEPKSLWDEEKGKFKKCFEDETVEKLFTTNSIYNLGDSKYVKVF